MLTKKGSCYSQYSTFSPNYSTLYINNNNNTGTVKTNKQPVIISPRAPMLEVLLNPIRSKFSQEKIMTKINDLDREGDFNKQTLDNLLKLIPTKDEQDMLKEEESKLENFSIVDRFLYETMNQTFYLEKLEFLEFRQYYQENFTFIDQKLHKIIRCCNSLTHSANIVKLFELILCIGNYLNQNSKNADALGFMISNLPKLCDVKSNKPNYSLLHFLILTIKKKVRT